MKYKIFAFEFDDSQKVFCSQDFDHKEVLSKYQAIWNSVFSVLLLSSLEDVYFNVVVNFVPNKVLTIRLCDAVAKAKMSYADIEVALLAAKKNPNGNSKFLIYASLHKNGSMFNIRKVSSFISVALSFFFCLLLYKFKYGKFYRDGVRKREKDAPQLICMIPSNHFISCIFIKFGFVCFVNRKHEMLSNQNYRRHHAICSSVL